ncbi:hypothetical protein Btru_058341 [Bulinus truncatus]|nr:hypothetical protein Btru_058341 [Bulinus truncatus]
MWLDECGYVNVVRFRCWLININKLSPSLGRMSLVQITEPQTSNTSLNPLISHHDYNLLMTILDAPLCLLTLTGIVTNTLNIMVFVRQGVLSDSMTVSLFTLTVSDILSCLFLLPQCLCIYLEKYVLSKNIFIRNCFVLSTLSATYPHILCTQITTMVTVYISIERAICVLFPLHVKSMIKTKNTALFMMFLFASEFILHIPFFINSPILWTSDPENNNSLIAINFQTSDGNLLYRINNLVESTVLTTAAMIIVIIATVTMVIRLQTSSIWRASAARFESKSDSECQLKASKQITSNVEYKMSKKDREVVKVVVCVTTVFLTCLSCGHIPGLTTYMIPGFSIDGDNRDLFQLFYSFVFFLDVFNASVNFLFYMKLSSKFRKTFYSIFRCSEK